MNELQIHELENNKVGTSITPFYSNKCEYVTSMDIKEGDYVTEDGTMKRLTDLSTLWVEAQVDASQLSFSNVGMQAFTCIPNAAEKEVKEKIEFVSPEINLDTRINLVRTTVDNPGNRLNSGVPAYMILKSGFQNSISLPADAVIRDNKGASVWVQISKNKFRYQMVETSIEINNRIEIKSGLKAGDVVVTSGAYLLNSEYIFKIGAKPMAGMKM